MPGILAMEARETYLTTTYSTSGRPDKMTMTLISMITAIMVLKKPTAKGM